MDPTKVTSHIPVLQGKENYREWAISVKATASYQGFWDHLLGGTSLVAPAATADAEEQAKFKQLEMN